MRMLATVGSAWVVLGLAVPGEPQGAVPKIDLSDAAGDVNEANNGPENARDVVKLSLGSDGKSIVVTATLAKDERSTMAGRAVALYFDTDDKAATGGKTRYGQGGFEFEGDLAVCHGDAGRIDSCAGGGDGKAPKARYALGTLERFTGSAGAEIQKYATTQTVSSGMGATPGPALAGRVLAVTFPYADLRVKPGDVVRVLALEADANDDGALPEVRLTLR